MSTWGLSTIKGAYEQGERMNATHMLVTWDGWENEAVYVFEGENPRDIAAKVGVSVDECYRYALGWESQSKERRAFHWETE